MRSRQVRRLATELSTRLFEREFLKSAGITKKMMQDIFVRNKWEEIFEEVFPVKRRFTCAEILEWCKPELWALCGEPEEGWMTFTYKYVTHILYPDEEFTKAAARFAPGARIFLKLMQFFFDEERKVIPFSPYDDFELLTEEEYSRCERADEYSHFVREFRNQYIYEMMRLNR
ncbi:MAG: hypothetical protein IJO13_10810 [Lachnospiraceae bacterium]|nr:hypothetical protein [Lachnospiraceae bacterium]